jgi:hypothetical protein
MRDLEGLWKTARAELVIPAEGGGSDVFLWEHSVRVATCAKYLSRLPEAQEENPDPLALLAAALFHEAGWISKWRAGSIKRHDILLGSSNESIMTESVRLMQKSLRDLVPPTSLQRASETIMSRFGSPPALIESDILQDADNLEEFGLGFLWMTIRRGICGGRGVQAVLDAWKRRIEYQFWRTRIQDAFRFEVSRQLAKARLQHLESLMGEMAVQHDVEDVRKMVESRRGCPLAPVDWLRDGEKRASQG